jgi:membrane-bound ClpP family serine protease
MEWLIIIALILFGLGLIIIEVIFVPGTTIVGIAGLIIGAYGVYKTYIVFGNATGNLVLTLSFISCIISFVIAFKTKSWQRFSLKNTIDSKVNQDFGFDLKVGDEGTSISTLKPIGSAVFKDQKVEVRSKGEWIGENQKVKVIKIDNQKIYVEPIN